MVEIGGVKWVCEQLSELQCRPLNGAKSFSRKVHMGEWMIGWLNRWMNGLTELWLIEWTNERIAHIHIFIHTYFHINDIEYTDIFFLLEVPQGEVPARLRLRGPKGQHGRHRQRSRQVTNRGLHRDVGPPGGIIPLLAAFVLHDWIESYGAII